MTVGLPGSGIGGLFYLASALWMPVHAAIRRMARSGNENQRQKNEVRVVARQFGIAVTIVAALWTTGWLLGLMIVSHPDSVGSLAPGVAERRIPNVLGVTALYLSVATLMGALISVEVARLVVRPRPSWRRRTTVTAAGSLVILFAPRALAQTAVAVEPAGHLAAAEAAYNNGDTATARREYQLVLSDDPASGRALFRLGLLSRNDSRHAVTYLSKYVATEPADAWGHMALGDALARTGNYRDALREYDRARAIVPDDRDAVIGRARVLIKAGRTDEAIAALSKWTMSHGDDAEALRLLADQQRRAQVPRGVALSMATSGSTDSDRNRSLRAVATVGARLADQLRAEIYGGRKRTTGFSEVTISEAGAALTVKPNAALQIETSAGGVRPVEQATVFSAADRMLRPESLQRLTTSVPGNGRGRGRGGSPGTGGDTSTVAPVPPGTVVNPAQLRNVTYLVGAARARWRQPGGLGLVDVRASRTALDANTLLLINRVVRSELSARADVPFSARLRARTGARVAQYQATDESNNRTALLGGLAYAATKSIDMSAVFQRIAFSHSTTSGYFAPRLAQLAEAGWYSEFESDNGLVLALDGGGGMQQQAGFGEALSAWKPAFRLYALLTVPIGTSGSEFRLDFDSYDSRLGSEAATSSSWRYASASASIRFALR